MRPVAFEPKRCACGRVHATREAWEALEPAAGGLYYADEYEIQEYRNCPCGSTNVIVIETSEPDSKSEVA